MVKATFECRDSMLTVAGVVCVMSSGECGEEYMAWAGLLISSACPCIEGRDWKLLTAGTLTIPVTKCACYSQMLGFCPNSPLTI